MRRLVLLLGFLPVLQLIAARPPHVNDSDPATHRGHHRRDVTCPPGKHPSGDICCDLCEPGSVKDTDCTTSVKTICKRCEEGEEYMDSYNYLPKCRRCSSCDPHHGFEVDKPCNGSQNVACRCKHGYFCNSPEPCRHCDPCTKCEDGRVVNECTQTNDTICERKQKSLWIIGAVGLATLPAVMLIWICWPKRMLFLNKETKDEQSPVELKPLVYPDIDLTPYISDIVGLMTREEVLKFVRKQGLTSPTIDDIEWENRDSASEKKIKLLQSWYQGNGIRGAYKTLITRLRDLKEHVLADKIEKMMAPHVQNSTAAHQNMDDDV